MRNISLWEVLETSGHSILHDQISTKVNQTHVLSATVLMLTCQGVQDVLCCLKNVMWRTRDRGRPHDVPGHSPGQNSIVYGFLNTFSTGTFGEGPGSDSAMVMSVNLPEN